MTAPSVIRISASVARRKEEGGRRRAADGIARHPRGYGRRADRPGGPRCVGGRRPSSSDPRRAAARGPGGRGAGAVNPAPAREKAVLVGRCCRPRHEDVGVSRTAPRDARTARGLAPEDVEDSVESADEADVVVGRRELLWTAFGAHAPGGHVRRRRGRRRTSREVVARSPRRRIRHSCWPPLTAAGRCHAPRAAPGLGRRAPARAGAGERRGGRLSAAPRRPDRLGTLRRFPFPGSARAPSLRGGRSSSGLHEARRPSRGPPP